MDFNPRSPCGERQATRWNQNQNHDFNPRSPCGERRVEPTAEGPLTQFQSTLPVWGATCQHYTHRCDTKFQSTLPVWGATALLKSVGDFIHKISIHAPRVGSDSFFSTFYNWCLDFNPRSPCGERLGTSEESPCRSKFQSTLPVWGATFLGVSGCPQSEISIHAPRVGSDWLLRT